MSTGMAVLTGQVLLGDRPAAGAEITVSPLMRGPWVTGEDGGPVILSAPFTTTTNASGSFELTVLGGGVPLTGRVVYEGRVAMKFSFSAQTGQTVVLSGVAGGTKLAPRPSELGPEDAAGSIILSGEGPPSDSLVAPKGSLYVDLLTGDVYTLV